MKERDEVSLGAKARGDASKKEGRGSLPPDPLE